MGFKIGGGFGGFGNFDSGRLFADIQLNYQRNTGKTVSQAEIDAEFDRINREVAKEELKAQQEGRDFDREAEYQKQVAASAILGTSGANVSQDARVYQQLDAGYEAAQGAVVTSRSASSASQERVDRTQRGETEGERRTDEEKAGRRRQADHRAASGDLSYFLTPESVPFDPKPEPYPTPEIRALHATPPTDENLNSVGRQRIEAHLQRPEGGGGMPVPGEPPSGQSP